jgi:hypothetical protein
LTAFEAPALGTNQWSLKKQLAKSANQKNLQNINKENLPFYIFVDAMSLMTTVKQQESIYKLRGWCSVELQTSSGDQVGEN